MHYPELMSYNDHESHSNIEKSEADMAKRLQNSEPETKHDERRASMFGVSGSTRRFSVFGTGTAETTAPPRRLGWQPAKTKSFYDLRRKNQMGKQRSMMFWGTGASSKALAKEKKRPSVVNGTGEISEAVADHDSDDEKDEEIAESTTPEPQLHDTSITLASLPETEMPVVTHRPGFHQVPTEERKSGDIEMGALYPETTTIVHSETNKTLSDHEVDDMIRRCHRVVGSGRLLYVGVLEKSGPSTMIWYPWLTRLVVINTKTIDYYSIPYLDRADSAVSSNSRSRGFHTSALNSVQSPANQIDKVKYEFLKTDLERFAQWMTNDVSTLDGGGGRVQRYLVDKGYKLKVFNEI